jgi:hypothetical protein
MAFFSIGRHRTSGSRVAQIEKIKAVFKGDEQFMILSVYYRQQHYHPAFALRNTLVLLYNSPSGLVFYWLLNNIFLLLKNGFQRIKKPTENTKNAAGEVLPDGARGIDGDRLSSKRCLVFSSLIFFLLAGLVIPCSLIASSVEEFSFIEFYTSPFPFILNTMTQSAALFLFWPLCIYFLAPKKAGMYISLGMALLAVFALINSFIFPGNYGFLTTPFWGLPFTLIAFPLAGGPSSAHRPCSAGMNTLPLKCKNVLRNP